LSESSLAGAGSGVFAKRDIPDDRVISQYVGFVYRSRK
jgi:hypothetical protein